MCDQNFEKGTYYLIALPKSKLIDELGPATCSVWYFIKDVPD